MARKIVRVAQRMLPIPSPPNPWLGFGSAAGRLWYLGPFLGGLKIFLKGGSLLL
jgi:hypothetical protein